MADIDKTIERLEHSHRQMINGYIYDLVRPDVVDDAVKLLKSQKEAKQGILKIIWDTLHGGFAIDTVADQDYVYEVIRNRIENCYGNRREYGRY